MGATAKRFLPTVLVLAASAWISLSSVVLGNQAPGVAPGDYPIDAAAAVNALAHLHLSAFLDAHYVMGPFSLLLRAPFAALAGSDQLAAYRWGCLPCVLAAGLLGLYLARLAGRRGSSTLKQIVIAAICLLNPLTLMALRSGHPEEILTAAFVVGAVALASEGHWRRTALLLGLALATKQWAVIAIFPVLMALPRARLRVALGAAAVALILTLPGFLANPEAFATSQGNVASTHAFVDAWSVWYPIAGSVPDAVASGPDGVIGEPTRGGSALVGRYAHPMIVLTAMLLPLALALRRRRFALSGPDAMALLALLALLRCALDPVDNIYYHVPLLLALIGWDALGTRDLPVRALLGAAMAALLWRWLPFASSDPHAFNAAYLALVVPVAAAIAIALWRPSRQRARRASAVGAGAPQTAGAS
jgi:hypothetical protein